MMLVEVVVNHLLLCALSLRDLSGFEDGEEPWVELGVDNLAINDRGKHEVLSCHNVINDALLLAFGAGNGLTSVGGVQDLQGHVKGLLGIALSIGHG